MQFHQNVKGGYVRGERYRVEIDAEGQAMLAPLQGGAKKPIPHAAPDRFEVYREERLGLAGDDRVRFCLGGTALDGKRRISNGRIDEVAGFDRAGNFRLKSGLVVAKDYGHLDYGFVITSPTRAASADSARIDNTAVAGSGITVSSYSSAFLVSARTCANAPTGVGVESGESRIRAFVSMRRARRPRGYETALN